jgi:hypothetical protein
VGYWVPNPADPSNATAKVWEAVYPGTTYLYALSTENVLFEQLCYYGCLDFSQHLTVLVLICIVLYFVTSSDSASFVVDIMAANGVEEPPTLQKVFWGCTEGVAAIALVLAAGDNNESLEAVKLLPIILGLPFTFLLFWMCQALIIVCKEESGEWARERKHFKLFLFNMEPMSWASFFVPFLPLAKVAERVWGGKALMYGLGYGFVWFLMITYFFAGIGDEQNAILGCAMYVCFGLCVCALRVGTRVKCGISGDMISDACASVFFMPWAVGQMFAEEVDVAEKEKDHVVVDKEAATADGAAQQEGATQELDL